MHGKAQPDPVKQAYPQTYKVITRRSGSKKEEMKYEEKMLL